MTDTLAAQDAPSTLLADPVENQGDSMTTPNALTAALDDPDLKALGDDAITNFLTQRQASLRQQLLDVTVGKQLALVTTDQPETQRNAQVEQLDKTAASLRATIALIDGALATPPAS